MMKALKIVGLLLLLLLPGLKGFAQTLSFCEDYTENGTPLRTGLTCDIAATGSYVYMIYQQPYKFTKNTVWLYVDRKSTTGEYVPYKTVELACNKYQNWLLYDIFFDKDGSYKVSLMSGGSPLATEYLTINFQGSTSTPSSSSSTDYSSASIKFCEKVTDGKPDGVYSIFNIPSTGGYVTVFVDNAGKSLNSSGFIVDVYKMEAGEYKFVETKNYTDIDPTWDWATFQYTFYNAGDYRFSVYNKESKIIKDGYVTIKFK